MAIKECPVCNVLLSAPNFIFKKKGYICFSDDENKAKGIYFVVPVAHKEEIDDIDRYWIGRKVFDNFHGHPYQNGPTMRYYHEKGQHAYLMVFTRAFSELGHGNPIDYLKDKKTGVTYSPLWKVYT